MELLVSLIEAEPIAKAETLFRRWLEIVREDEDYLIPALQHTFANLYNALSKTKRRRKSTNIADRKKQQQKIEAAAQAVSEMILLDLTLPNGKKLRDATFRECTEAGGWWIKIGKKGKPNQIVGKVLSEKDIQAIKR
jgi:hypothetical protein